jgi:hypothetical protein
MKLHYIRLAFLISAALVTAAGLAACSPSAAAPGSPTMDSTQAYQTVEARLTQVTLINSEEKQPTPLPAVETPAPTITLAPTRTPPQFTQPVPTPTAEACNRAAPGTPRIDVTIDDDTQMEPGQRFTKIWRLTNSGTCTWTRDYSAVWFSGPKFGEVSSVRLAAEVQPGQSIDIIVDMTAPETPASYQSNWKLQNASGEMFGIGPSGNSPFWVRIVVVPPPTLTPSPTTSPSPTFTPTLEPTPSPTPSPTPVVAASGQISMTLDQRLDLDSGSLVEDESADLAYQQDDFGIQWLSPRGGAVLGIYGSSEPSLEACQSAAMSAASIGTGSFNMNTYLCYRTSQGRPGWLRLIEIDEEASQITLAFTTWANSGGP